jgi:flavodoxin
MNSYQISHPDFSEFKDFLKSLIKMANKHKMVVFKNAAFIQPFPHNTALVTIEDKRKGAQSIVTILSDYKKSLEINTCYFPPEMKRVVSQKNWDSYEFLAAPKDMKDKWFLRKDEIPKELFETIEIKNSEQFVCSDFKLSNRQMVEVLEDVIFLEAWPSIKEKWQNNIEDAFQSFYNTINGIWCEERPIRIYVCGCDDSSYTLVVSSKEEAKEIFEKIQDGATYETLKNLGFVFSN